MEEMYHNLKSEIWRMKNGLIKGIAVNHMPEKVREYSLLLTELTVGRISVSNVWRCALYIGECLFSLCNGWLCLDHFFVIKGIVSNTSNTCKRIVSDTNNTSVSCPKKICTFPMRTHIKQPFEYGGMIYHVWIAFNFKIADHSNIFYLTNLNAAPPSLLLWTLELQITPFFSLSFKIKWDGKISRSSIHVHQ